jgi:hypothetical protein
MGGGGERADFKKQKTKKRDRGDKMTAFSILCDFDAYAYVAVVLMR